MRSKVLAASLTAAVETVRLRAQGSHSGVAINETEQVTLSDEP